MFFLPVMLWLLSAGSARVVQDFRTECGEFFYHNLPPTVFPAPRFRQICQTLNDKPYFATLYDTYNKIPVYSAYKFTGGNCLRNSLKNWYIEPQLENLNLNSNMVVLERILFENQASNSDYQGSGFDRGHLAPVSHANSQGCADATFTLTNAAPQNRSFNRGQWNKVEGDLKEYLSNNCKNKIAHIVTGVVPGFQTINNRVRVPSFFWTAYCCENNGIISGGFIGYNHNIPLVHMTVPQLEIYLRDLYVVRYFRLFHNNCREAVYVPVIKKTSTVTLQNSKSLRLKMPYSN